MYASSSLKKNSLNPTFLYLPPLILLSSPHCLKRIVITLVPEEKIRWRDARQTQHVQNQLTTCSSFLLPNQSWAWACTLEAEALHSPYKAPLSSCQAISFLFSPGIACWAHSRLHFLFDKQPLIFHKSADTTSSFNPFLKSCPQPGKILSPLCHYIMQIKNHFPLGYLTCLPTCLPLLKCKSLWGLLLFDLFFMLSVQHRI